MTMQLGVGAHMIGKWCNRFIADWIKGLYDEVQTGTPSMVEDGAMVELITKTLTRKPKAATHWSVRAVAKDTGTARAPSIACSSSSACNLAAVAASSSRPIPSLSRSCATWSGFISTRPTRP